MSSSTDRPLVGILGGMGPAATIDFYTKLLACTPGTRDQDHLPVVIWSDPRVPDRSKALLGVGEDPSVALSDGLRALAGAGARLVAVPCNSAHAFVPGLAAQAGLELVSIIDVTAAALGACPGPGGVVGLLATRGTVVSRLYHRACARHGVRVVHPSSSAQSQVDRVIAAVKAGTTGNEEAAALASVTDHLVQEGAQIVVAGCTELILAMGASEPSVPIVDPAMLLAREVARRSMAEAVPV